MQPKRRTSKLTASYIKKLRREHEQAETRVATAKKRLGEFNFLIRNERRFMKEIQEKLKVLDEELKRKQTETVNKEITDKQMKCSICDQSYRGFTKSAPMILACGHSLCRDCMHKTKEGMLEMCEGWYMDQCPFDNLYVEFNEAIVNKDVLQYNIDLECSTK